jgi:hypothetical protein
LDADKTMHNTAVMEQHVFVVFIDYRGHHRKGVAILNATQVNLKQKLWFH